DLAGLRGDRRHQVLRRAEEMGRGEQHRERGRQASQRRPGLPGRPVRRLAGVRGEDQGSSRLHQPRLLGPSFGPVAPSRARPVASFGRVNEPIASRPHMPGYGTLPAGEGGGLLPWSWAEERLARSHDYWLATVTPDGAPHLMPVWAVWLDGRL